MGSIFFEITVILTLAAALAILFKFIKQPPVLAYILAGVLIGPLALFKLQGQDAILSLGEIGITLLLFMLGLELRLSDLKSVGKIAILTGIGQIVFTSIIGFFICMALGFSQITSIYLSVALTFSSTIIIVKLLSDKKDLSSLYGKISIGFLLVQDFVAIIALILLSGFNTGGAESSISLFTFGFLMLKAVVLFGWIIVIGKYVLPPIVIRIARSSELLFLFSIAWAFGVSAIVASPFIGFSIEIGGFLAGLALANSSENFQIISKVKSLRDFFITIFFVTLGTRMAIDHLDVILIPGIILSVFILIGNPFIVMVILGALGYKKRTSFLAGLTVAQISEFSLIVAFMGHRLGHVPDQAVSLLTFVGGITFVVSTYMILGGNTLYKKLSPFLDIFERKNVREKKIDLGVIKDHTILVGANRTGRSILEALIKNEKKLIVVDFDPDVIEKLKDEGVEAFYGDIADPEIQERVALGAARLVISTVPDIEDNLLLLTAIRHLERKPKVIAVAFEKSDAKELYENGANYVVMPHVAGGHHLAKILLEDNHIEIIEKYKEKDLLTILAKSNV